MKTPLTGILPVAPTPFHADGAIGDHVACRTGGAGDDHGKYRLRTVGNSQQGPAEWAQVAQWLFSTPQGGYRARE